MEQEEFSIPRGRGLEALIRDTRAQYVPNIEDSEGPSKKTRVAMIGRVYIDEQIKHLFVGKNVNVFLRVEEITSGPIPILRPID